LAAAELDKDWGSPVLLFAIIILHAVVARFVLGELFPTPSWHLIIIMSTMAVVNFIIKVVYFAQIRHAPHTEHASSWPRELEGKRLSIIFPAYNEGDGIGIIAKAALASTKAADVEVIVVDDRSKDHTWQVLQNVLKSTQDKRFKPVAGCERGKVAWKGKNWSCTQGYEAASGDYLLFCDADVTLKPGAVESFLTAMVQSEPSVGWISFVPKTRFSCLAEYLFNWPGTMISQALIPRSVNSGKKTYAFGQCNLFERNVYKRLGGHREIGHLIAESHALAARARELHVPMRCQLAYDHAELVWYFNILECWKGQLKSIRGRMSQRLPIINRLPPRPAVALLMSVFLSWQLLPWLLLLLQGVKIVESSLCLRDYLLLAACSGSVACSFFNRFLGWMYLGYDMTLWWLAPVTSSCFQMLLAIRACRPDTDGRWNDGAVPEGFCLPKDAGDAHRKP